MEPVISVIIPVYKVEPYLRKCLDSVCDQTLREMEIILVDDGSPDHCGKICEEYAARDDRIRVIHQENRGLSGARNVGIALARADIIGFVDSDDWIEPDMFALLYRNLIRENADISVCGRTEHKNGRANPKGSGVYTVQSKREAVQNVFELNGVGMAAWNKIYRKHLFQSIRFPEGRIYEDAYVMVRLVDAAEKVVFDMQPKYHYVRRQNSITMHAYRPAMHDAITGTWGNYTYISEKYPELANLAWESWINAQFAVLLSMFAFCGAVDSDKENEIICALKENRKAIWSHPGFSGKRKLILGILCVSKPLCKGFVRMCR